MNSESDLKAAHGMICYECLKLTSGVSSLALRAAQDFPAKTLSKEQFCVWPTLEKSKGF